MIKLPGVLHIRIITGRNGDFRVGRLVTDIGEFAVKDAELDQYDEGRYEGYFGISQIYPCWRRLKIDHLEGFVPIEF